MKPVTAYKSFDGNIFSAANECAEYETHCRKIACIIDKLPRFQRDYSFEIGMKYYQHTPEVFLPIRDEFFTYIKTKYNNRTFENSIGVVTLPQTSGWYIQFFQRQQDNPSMLAWQYLGYVDDKFRQWSQLFFINNTNEEAVPINHL